MIISDTDSQYFGLNRAEPFADLAALRPGLLDVATAILRNRHDAEDAVQDALARAWRGRDTFREGADAKPWLRRIVARSALDILTRDRSVTGAPIDEAGDPPAGDVEGEVVARELRSEIADAARRLSLEQRQAFVMHDVRGYSSAEIAGLESIPYSTVRTRLRRARREMRKFVSERGLVA